ncbi:MAG TPA: hypothetical protein VEX60_05225 [Pyrinomonadaceae bacterium]|nr:hypothetical protein [Pyrinomonadaceae bacterium]
MPLLRLLLLALFFVIVLSGRAANAASYEFATHDKSLKRAEAVVAKLRRLEAAAAQDSGAYRRAVEKIYPGLFASVADLRDGDIKTDLSTAAALYETAQRTGATTGNDAPDCSRELRASYFQLCRASHSRTHLLWAKARLHTRFAEAAILYARGDRSSATLDALAQMRAERAGDLALAEEALRALKELAAEMSSDSFAEAVAHRASLVPAKQNSERVAATLGHAELVLASLPRGRVHQLLRNARDAFRDSLSWQLKATPARALVVSVNSLDAPDPLRQINLRADDAERAALQNWHGALKFIGKVEAVIGESRGLR